MTLIPRIQILQAALRRCQFARRVGRGLVGSAVLLFVVRVMGLLPVSRAYFPPLLFALLVAAGMSTHMLALRTETRVRSALQKALARTMS